MPDADVRRYVVGVLDKLAEARFFLRKIEGTNDFLEGSYYTSAFGSACYSLRLCLMESSKSLPAAHQWWSEKLEGLKASPMHRYFHEGRNEDIHQGFGLVTGMEMELIESGDELITRESWSLAEKPAYSPGPPAQECRDYFESLVRLALEGYRRFAATWDPGAAYAHEFDRFEGEELRPTH